MVRSATFVMSARPRASTAGQGSASRGRSEQQSSPGGGGSAVHSGRCGVVGALGGRQVKLGRGAHGPFGCAA